MNPPTKTNDIGDSNPSGRSSSNPHWQDICEAYVSLCHDDPIVASDEACQYLAEALIDPKSPLGLSERLVNGIRQAALRTTAVAADSATPAGYAMLALVTFLRVPLLCCQATDIAQIRRDLGSYRGPPPPPPALADNDDDDEGEDDTDDNHDQDPINHPLLHENHSAAFGNGHASRHDPDPEAEVWADESDPSDFEYDSGAQEYQQQLEEDMEARYYCHFDPLALSQPPPPQTDEAEERYTLSQAVVNLLAELAYHKLSVLADNSSNSRNFWIKWQVSDFLTQLTLTLLVLSTDDPQTFCLLRDPPSTVASATAEARRIDWRKWGLEPLWVLRDAALAHPPQHLADYLALLQTLLAVDGVSAANLADQHRLGQRSQHPHDATMVGFAAFSSLCHEISHRKDHKAFSVKTTRKCLLGCIDDLAQILNKCLSHQPRDITTIMQIVWNLLPMLDLLTGIRGSEDGTLLGSTASESICSMSNTEAQGLLNSSLYREILFLYIATATDGSVSSTPKLGAATTAAAAVTATATSACCRPLGRCIMILMAQSPNLLGKYAWRVPQFSSLVVDDNQLPADSQHGQIGVKDDNVDRLLWNLLGNMADSTTAATSTLNPPRVVWKTKSLVKPTASPKNFSSNVWAYLENLCNQCVAAMTDLKQVRLYQQQQQQLPPSVPPRELSESHPVRAFKNKYQTTLQDMTFLTQSFQSCQPLAQSFVQTILAQSDKQRALQAKLREMQDAISNLPSAPSSSISTSPSGRLSSIGGGPRHDAPAAHEHDSDDDDDESDDHHHHHQERNQGRRSVALFESHEESVSQLRKAIKTISSLMLSSSLETTNSDNSSPQNDVAKSGTFQNLASKTD